MALWVVRAGKYGEREDYALDNNLVAIGWDQINDYSHFKTKQEIEKLLAGTSGNQKQATIEHWARQLWAFKEKIKVGDIVALPLKSVSSVAFGKITGTYEYKPDAPPGARHTRSVKWIRTDIARSSLDEDIRNSLGGFSTVYQIQRNNIEQRILAILESGDIPPSDIKPKVIPDEEQIQVSERAEEELRTYIGQNFQEHKLAWLVNEILIAQGFETRLSPAGPDGGIDILAGRGPLGLDQPRLCVQVKSQSSPLSAAVFRELLGTMGRTGADYGLLVCWGGFTDALRREARDSYFKIRLWDSGNLIEAIKEYYEHLSSVTRAELPLKRIWVLAAEDEV